MEDQIVTEPSNLCLNSKGVRKERDLVYSKWVKMTNLQVLVHNDFKQLNFPIETNIFDSLIHKAKTNMKMCPFQFL